MSGISDFDSIRGRTPITAMKNTMRIRTILSLLLLSWLSAAQAESPIPSFSSSGLQGWEPEVFSGNTRYETTRQENGQCIRAESHGTASGLIHKAVIDLNKTPQLSWSWRVDAPLQNLAEREKTGDDYVSRIFVIAKDGLAFWNTRSINYVWSSSAPVGAHWPSPYNKNIHMVVIESGMENAGKWCNYQRDIRLDFKTYLGADVEKIDAVAIMTDTDNTQADAVAWYGDISFH